MQKRQAIVTKAAILNLKEIRIELVYGILFNVLILYGIPNKTNNR